MATVRPDLPELPTDRLTLMMGPAHPATHGIIRFVPTLSGETIVDMEVEIGFLHRGFEKSCEVRTYNQIIPLTDRLNYVSAPCNNVGYVLAANRLFGIEVPRRGQVMMTLFCEISRVIDHLTCIAAVVMELGAFTGFLYFVQARDLLYKVLERQCGARVTTNLTRVGGMARDLYDGYDADIRGRLAEIRTLMIECHGLFTRNRIFYDRTRGTGVISADEALDRGFTGPCLRSTGVAYDVRRDDPYLIYPELTFEVPVGTKGDNYDRYLVRMQEIDESIGIIEQCLDLMPDGPYAVADPHVTLVGKDAAYGHIEGLIHHFELFIRGPTPPPGEVYVATESPNGELGVYLVSDGTGRPVRCRVRPVCLPMTQAMPALVRGQMVADIIPTFGSINMIGGELDR